MQEKKRSMEMKSDDMMHELLQEIKAEYQVSEDIKLEGKIQVSFVEDSYTGWWYGTIFIAFFITNSIRIEYLDAMIVNLIKFSCLLQQLKNSRQKSKKMAILTR